MDFSNIIAGLEDGIEYIVLNRPEVLNALDIDTISEIREAIDIAGSEDEVKAVIISGSNGRAFCSGADISEMKDMSNVSGREMIANGQALMKEIEYLDKPVIAAVNGYCIGSGFELALACDIRIASDTAVFSFPELSLGIIPGYGGIHRLSRVIGNGASRYYCMTGERIDAARAYELGLVGRVCAPQELMDRARDIALVMEEKSAAAFASLKKIYREGADKSLNDALAIEIKEFDRLFSAPERVERMSAFQ